MVCLRRPLRQTPSSIPGSHLNPALRRGCLRPCTQWLSTCRLCAEARRVTVHISWLRHVCIIAWLSAYTPPHFVRILRCVRCTTSSISTFERFRLGMCCPRCLRFDRDTASGISSGTNSGMLCHICLALSDVAGGCIFVLLAISLGFCLSRLSLLLAVSLWAQRRLVDR
jgi:hypothetical protein